MSEDSIKQPVFIQNQLFSKLLQPFSPGASIKRLSTPFSARQQLFQVLAVPLRPGGVCALFGVDVGISGKFIVAVTKPGLNVLQGIPQAIEDGRAAIP